MPVLCSSCSSQRPFGDFIQVSYKVNPAGSYREITQRANGLRISEWNDLESNSKADLVADGILCMHDHALILEATLTIEEKELLVDKRLPKEIIFDSDAILIDLKELSNKARSEIYVHEIPSYEGAFNSTVILQSWMIEKLQKMGISSLYQHQAEAIEYLRDGRNVVLCTQTASGKSLAYNIPILEKLTVDSEATALYLSPFKALVDDQFSHLKKWADTENERQVKLTMDGFAKFFVNQKELSVGVLHGQNNTPEHLRKDQARDLVFEKARYWLTNVHYLHLVIQGVITNPKKAAHLQRYFKNLSYVVIDELHQYSGMLGSKVSMMIRRIRMICERLGNRDIKFIACSATIANPKYLAEELTGKRGIQGFHEVMGSQAPMKRKQIFMWNPGGSEADQQRKAVVSDLYEILRSVYKNDRWPRCIIFSSNRQQAQLLSRELNIIMKSHLQDKWELTGDTELFLPYHAYLTTEVKEKTIRKLEQGEILGVVTTSALEVGIDIKTLDLCIILGYPGSQASFWQQAGRVGRNRDGIVIMMLQEEPLQQYFSRQPYEFFHLPAESAVINTSNQKLVSEHLTYAAHEQGGTIANAKNYFRPSSIRKVVLDNTEFWVEKDNNMAFIGETPKYKPLMKMGESYTVVTRSGWSDEVLFQNVDQRSLIRDYHVDAVFLGSDNRGFYKVKWINKAERKVVAESVKTDYHTRGIIRDSIEVIEVAGTLVAKDMLKLNTGQILVKRSTFGYKKIYNHSSKPAETVQLQNTYPVSFTTDAFWLMWEDAGRRSIQESLRHLGNGSELTLDELCEGSLHTAEHAIASAVPAIVKCSMSDFRHHSFYAGTTLFGMPGMFFYDSEPGGGSGIVEAIAEKFDVLLKRAIELASSCNCVTGCPSCIQLFQCERQNESLHKAGGLLILRGLLK